nr:MAG TPA: hypothetical protein [Caudoviricetes sp.]
MDVRILFANGVLFGQCNSNHLNIILFIKNFLYYSTNTVLYQTPLKPLWHNGFLVFIFVNIINFSMHCDVA